METEADQLLRIVPAVQPIKPSLITPEGGSERSSNHDDEGDDDHFQRALAESRHLVERDDTALQRALDQSRQEEEEVELQRALRDSMTESQLLVFLFLFFKLN